MFFNKLVTKINIIDTAYLTGNTQKTITLMNIF